MASSQVLRKKHDEARLIREARSFQYKKQQQRFSSEIPRFTLRIESSQMARLARFSWCRFGKFTHEWWLLG